MSTSYTVARALSGFFIAILVGVPIGLILGNSPVWDRYFGPFIDSLRSTPATALFPLFVVAFGVGGLSEIAVTCFACLWSMVVYTAYGVRTAGAFKRDLLRLHAVSTWQYLIDGLLFPALPSVTAAMRVLVSVSLVVTIGTEMIIGASQGLGQTIFDAQNTFQTPKMYGAILMAGFVGLAVNKALSYIVEKYIPWAEAAAHVR